MKCEMRLGILAALLTAAIVLADEDFLAEKPSYLTSCNQTDPNFKRCFGNNFQVIFNEWKDGVPGLNSVGSLEPLYIKRVSVVQDNNNPVVQLNVQLSNIKARGTSKLKVEDISFDSDKMIITVIYFAPKFDIDSQYTMKGHILNLALNGHGVSTMIIDDAEITIRMHFNRRDEYGLVFFDIDKLHLEITKIGGVHIQLDNLFNGLKELEDSTNAIINQNWRAFYEVLGPSINSGFQTVIADRFKKILSYLPVSYYLDYLHATN